MLGADGSRLRLDYVDSQGVSTEEIKTIGVVLGAAGQPDPVNEGLVLTGNWYFKLD